jgi:penicillin-binding protein 1A
MILALAGASVGVVYFWTLFRDATDMMGTLHTKLEAVIKRPSVIVSADGQTLYQVSAENRIPVRLSQVPDHVKNAILAAEDKRFYDHPGFDAVGLARAVVSTLRDQRVTQGGSTLTMQLAKRLYSGSERTMDRKMQDIAIAAAMERELSKDEILQLYLNQVYFGEGAYGIGAAAMIYFGKKVEDLTVAEAAMLARCVRRPSSQNPFADYERSVRNMKVVLQVMFEENMLDRPGYEQALTERPKLNPNPPKTTARRMRAPYFVEHVLAVLREVLPEVDLQNGGYRVETTLDVRLQAVAEREVGRIIREFRRQRVTTGAFVVTDREGRILAEVGGGDFDRNQFNVIWQGARQPGSAFKPFVYAAALATGEIRPDGSVSNARQRFWDAGTRTYYQPDNLGADRWGRTVSLKSAMAYSINRPAVNTLAQIGPLTAVAYARDAFGFPASRFRTVSRYSYSLALGTWPVSPLEMAEAYSVFMLGGDRVRPQPIVRVIGPDGQVVRRFDTVRFRRALNPGVATTIDGLLREVVESGTGTVAKGVPNARGKTGTTQDGRDAWFAGYTDGLVGIGWVANYRRVNGRPVYDTMPTVYGGAVTARLWAAIMKEAHSRHATKITLPPEVEAVPKEARRPAEAPIPEPQPELETPEPELPDLESDSSPPSTDERDPASSPEDPDNRPIASTPPPVPPATPRTTASPPARSAAATARTARREPETVEVDICADTGMRASMYCPETVPRRFERGKAPRRECTTHGRRGNN